MSSSMTISPTACHAGQNQQHPCFIRALNASNSEEGKSASYTHPTEGRRNVPHSTPHPVCARAPRGRCHTLPKGRPGCCPSGAAKDTIKWQMSSHRRRPATPADFSLHARSPYSQVHETARKCGRSSSFKDHFLAPPLTFRRLWVGETGFRQDSMGGARRAGGSFG